jgi:hypothetical protein
MQPVLTGLVATLDKASHRHTIARPYRDEILITVRDAQHYGTATNGLVGICA